MALDCGTRFFQPAARTSLVLTIRVNCIEYPAGPGPDTYWT